MISLVICGRGVVVRVVRSMSAPSVMVSAVGLGLSLPLARTIQSYSSSAVVTVQLAQGGGTSTAPAVQSSPLIIGRLLPIWSVVVPLQAMVTPLLFTVVPLGMASIALLALPGIWVCVRPPLSASAPKFSVTLVNEPVPPLVQVASSDRL